MAINLINESIKGKAARQPELVSRFPAGFRLADECTRATAPAGQLPRACRSSTDVYYDRREPFMEKPLFVAILASFCLLTADAASGQAVDPGIRTAGTPGSSGLPGLNTTEEQLFNSGFAGFGDTADIAAGLGPRFNGVSCGQCHTFPAFGGSSPSGSNPQELMMRNLGGRNVIPSFITSDGPIREARLKRKPDGSPDGSVHQLFVISGMVFGGDASGCNIAQPDFDAEAARNNVSLRIVTPVFGLGLVEQIAESTILNNIAANAARKAALGISARVNRGPNDDRVGRFGWKAQNVSLEVFSAEAFAVEQGQTNMTFPNESDEAASCQFDRVPNIARTVDAQGMPAVDFTERAALFMQFLAPSMPHATIPGGAPSIQRGRTAFETVGCAMCHTPTLRSRAEADYPALANQDVNLFSDLALHNMGPGLADDVVQGRAGGDEFRTAPLWGVGTRAFFLHDGRTSNIIEAIRAHRSAGNRRYGPSEANAVIDSYDALPATAQQDLVNFLRSL
jgi:CxxC motif-containing protein (DUF1111 family)